MKKTFISTIVILSFLVYSWYIRTTGQMNALPLAAAPTPAPMTPAPQPATPYVMPRFFGDDEEDEGGHRLPVPPISPTTAAPQPTTSTSTSATASRYKDGTYTGSPADAFYGYIQVRATIAGGRLTNVAFVQAPNDRGQSVEINTYADPILAQEAIRAQSAQVDIVSGATDSSQAFIQSLQSALDQAK